MTNDENIIELDSPLAKKIGFTSNLFEGYLGLDGKYIYISFIISLKSSEGNLSKLFNNILKLGYGIKIPTPFNRMKEIAIKKGFTGTKEYFKEASVYIPVFVLENKK
jgi:hypothetical protein